jgi:hypothetical protein
MKIPVFNWILTSNKINENKGYSKILIKRQKVSETNQRKIINKEIIKPLCELIFKLL